MADIELVIKTPEEMWERVKEGYVPLGISKYLRNSTPLPERHGRLIDADELYGDFIDGTEGYDCNTWNRIEIGDIIEDAPTIIEADKEE